MGDILQRRDALRMPVQERREVSAEASGGSAKTKEVFPYSSENINRRIQYFAENELERHAVLNGGKEVNND